MKKMAIISSYRISCGIADYTERLEPVFRQYYDVEVLPLDVEVLKSANKELVQQGNLMIDNIAQRVKEFDYVSIQFEVGLFGPTEPIVRQRLFKILNNCKNVILTFHSVNFNSAPFPKKILLSRHFLRELKDYLGSQRWPKFYDRVVKKIQQLDNIAGRSASIVVHDNKTKRLVQRLYNFNHIYAHPLGLSSEAERAIPHTAEEVAGFKKQYHLPENVKTIGVFGFVSEYKGHMVALKALRHLPQNYHLMIFGAQHPAAIQPFVSIDGYLNQLLNYIEECNQSDLKNAKSLSQFTKEPLKPFSERVHFVGEVNNYEFSKAMRCCDFVALPYIEVNQMGSGIAALAIENRAKMVFANTKCFAELQEFFPDCFSKFDIGNYQQLAYNILHFEDKYQENIDRALKEHNLEINVKEYISIFERTE